MMRYLLAASLSLIAVPGGARADAVDDAVRAEMARQRIPGLSIAIVKDGTVERLGGYGLANIELDVPVKADTVFQAGSIAKQFTALAIVQLAQAGRLSLDDHLSRFFPDAPAAWGDIRLHHLLSHVSGIEDDASLINLQTNPDARQLRALIWRMPRPSPAGARFHYSDMGYILLGQIIEQITGAPYHRYLDAHFFRPLGMVSTRALDDRAIIPNRSSGYEEDHGTLLNQRWVSPVFNATADGSTYTTARDFAAYLVALDNPPAWLAPLAETISRPTTLNDKRQQPYGMGWFVTAANGQRLIYHSGSWQGFKCIVVRWPDARKAFVAFGNADVMDSYALLQAVLPVAMPGSPVPPETETLQPAPAPADPAGPPAHFRAPRLP